MTNERVHFRIAHMLCCGTVLCLVNPRYPNYCPECGVRCYPQVKTWLISDFGDAIIKYNAIPTEKGTS
jgi:hypothetical protein